jgi:hypothetical protein
MHRREFGANSPAVVLDLLALNPDGTLRVFAETSEPKGQIGGFDGHARLKNAKLRATRKGCSSIEGGSTRAGPEAQAHIAQNGWNRAIQLRVDTEVRDDDAGNQDAEFFGKPGGNGRTVLAEEESLRAIKRDANAKTERPGSRGGRPPRGGWRAAWLGAGIAGLRR